MDAGVFSEVVGVSAFVSVGAVVFVVEFFAGVFGGFGSVDLSFEGVGEVAAESVLAVSHVVMNAGVEAAIDVFLAAVFLSFAFFDCEVLVGTEVFDHFQFAFQLFVFQELLVVHSFVDFY